MQAQGQMRIGDAGRETPRAPERMRRTDHAVRRAPTDSPERAAPPARLIDFLRWVAPMLARRRGLLVRVALMSCVASLMALAQPWLAMVLVDDGALAGNLRTLLITCVLMLVAPLIGLGLEAVTRFDYLALSSHVLFGLRERVFAQLQRQPPAYYAQVGYGDLVARFDGDLAEVQRFAVDGPLAVLNGLFNLVALTVLLVLLNPWLALVTFAIVPVQLYVTLRYRGRMEHTTGDVRRQATRLSAYFLDSLRALKLIQSSNGEAARLAGLRGCHADYYGALRAAQEAGFVLTAWQRVTGLLGTALVFGVGGYLLASRQLSVGVLLAFVIYAARAAGPVQTLLGVISGWQRARVSLGRLGELFAGQGAEEHARDIASGDELAPAAEDSLVERERVAPHAGRGSIVLDRVDFTHRDGRRVLRDANLRIDAGHKVLIVGASGGGKSTLADLLLGHLQPTAGTVQLDGVPLATMPLADLRRRVAVVDQEPSFLPGTVADNLRIVAPQASDAELRTALSEAGLSVGEVDLETPVGAAVAALSRGQRLRLALARAMLQRPAVLILDETTSAVDAEMEQQLLATVDRRFAQCTRVIITHHPQALQAAAVDAAWQLHDGAFVPFGLAEVAHAD